MNEWFPLIKICKEDYNKMKKSRRIKKFMRDNEPLLVPYYFLDSFHSFIFNFGVS